MQIIRRSSFGLVLLVLTSAAFSQMNRVSYNNQQLFLSGSNLAWVNYGQDIGLGTTDTAAIGNWMLQMHQHGGNAMRMWLSVEGIYGYTFDTNGRATGLAPNTISDLKKVLKLGWDREIGVNFCLWGFGMLTSTLDTNVLSRNKHILTDTSYTNAYIRNCLVPMVQALAGNPALISWEIFNEPEGMSNEFGWSGYQHTPMANIQKFVNLLAGAIHRTDPHARVTNGAVTLASLTDVTSLAKINEQGLNLSTMSSTNKLNLENWFNQKYRRNMPAQTADEIVPQLKKLTANNYNYYRDDRLIATGGDSLGILDFYCFHYYEQNGVPQLSPFTHLASKWNLTKPLVVAEFGMEYGSHLFIDNVPTAKLFDTLYANGYAGALPWSWSDHTFSSQTDMISGMQSLWNAYRADVDLLGAGADWPMDTIIYPLDGATFPDSNKVTIQVAVTDSSAITSVNIIVNGTLKIATLTTAPYTFTWTNITAGIYSITAVATNILGHTQTSGVVKITVGTPTMVRLEAENAVLHNGATANGTMTVVTDNTASNNKYVSINTSDTNATITWKLTSVPAAGNYPVTFGFKVPYGTKYQFININGVRVDTMFFYGISSSQWYDTTIYVNLAKDTNKIQMQMSWGWMFIDYIAVPTSLVPTSVDTKIDNIPTSFALEQNYPNPFNPSTTIRYSLPQSGQVKLIVYDVLGRQVATLIDEKQNAGVFAITFNAARLTSGVYFYRLNIGTFTQTKKMLMLK